MMSVQTTTRRGLMRVNIYISGFPPITVQFHVAFVLQRRLVQALHCRKGPGGCFAWPVHVPQLVQPYLGKVL
jgi:hypothetical protein